MVMTRSACAERQSWAAELTPLQAARRSFSTHVNRSTARVAAIAGSYFGSRAVGHVAGYSVHGHRAPYAQSLLIGFQGASDQFAPGIADGSPHVRRWRSEFTDSSMGALVRVGACGSARYLRSDARRVPNGRVAAWCHAIQACRRRHGGDRPGHIFLGCIRPSNGAQLPGSA